MSERLLEAFREDAERSTPLPDFELIAAAGRRRRLRRHTLAGAVAACVLGASGLLATAYDDSAGPQPAGDPDERSLGTAYPGLTNTTLPAGTYVLRPSSDTSLPSVRFTLPDGWNSWRGPNRFAGLDDLAADEGRTNRELLEEDPEWLLGMLVLDVKWILRPGCTMSHMTGDDITAVARALANVPRLTVTAGPDRTVRFGRPAVHLRLREHRRGGSCVQDTLIHTGEAAFGYLGRGTTIDAWVLDVDGRALVVWSVWTARTPRAEVQDLMGIVESVEVLDP